MKNRNSKTSIWISTCIFSYFIGKHIVLDKPVHMCIFYFTMMCDYAGPLFVGFHIFCMSLGFCPGPEDIKLFMLNSTEHNISTAHKN